MVKVMLSPPLPSHLGVERLVRAPSFLIEASINIAAAAPAHSERHALRPRQLANARLPSKLCPTAIPNPICLAKKKVDMQVLEGMCEKCHAQPLKGRTQSAHVMHSSDTLFLLLLVF